jgi:hypothetical protein
MKGFENMDGPFHFHIHHESDPRLDQILSLLQIILRLVQQQGAQTMAAIDDLEAAVSNETTVEDGVETLLTELTGMIQSLQLQSTDPATAARIAALVQTVTTRSATLAAAVATNTPATTSAPTTTAAPGGTTTTPAPTDSAGNPVTTPTPTSQF